MKPVRMLVLLATASLLGALLATGVTLAVNAGATGSSTTYYACLKGGQLSKVATAPPTCRTGATPISWNSQGPAGAGGISGLQEFTSSAAWTVPAGVTHVLVEAAGGGGGGGPASAVKCGTTTGTSSAGQPGGSGGFIQVVAPVSPGERLTVQVGNGGSGAPTDGVAIGGTASELIDPMNTVLATGGGGAAGVASAASCNFAIPPSAASGGPASSTVGGVAVMGGGCKMPASVSSCGLGGNSGVYVGSIANPSGAGGHGDVVLQW